MTQTIQVLCYHSIYCFHLLIFNRYFFFPPSFSSRSYLFKIAAASILQPLFLNTNQPVIGTHLFLVINIGVNFQSRRVRFQRRPLHFLIASHRRLSIPVFSSPPRTFYPSISWSPFFCHHSSIALGILLLSILFICSCHFNLGLSILS